MTLFAKNAKHLLPTVLLVIQLIETLLINVNVMMGYLIMLEAVIPATINVLNAQDLLLLATFVLPPPET